MRFFILTVAVFSLAFIVPAHAERRIPVDRVVLSTSGLGYFEHKARIDVAEKLSFSVRQNQVNDILKSLLVFDPEGALTEVTLPGRQPLDQLFSDLPFSKSELDNPVMLLNAYQGAEIKITNDGKSFSGRLVGITAEQITNDDDQYITRHRIGVLTAEGLKNFIYEESEAISWSDPEIHAEIARALSAVREAGDSESRRLNIGFAKAPARDVVFSYVVEVPLWKSAYRLVLPAKDGGKGRIQGWAIVENMTGSDWRDVELSLTSGNPVTLQQELYTAYYTKRPFVPVDVFGRVMPRRDEGAIGLLDSAQRSLQYGGRAGGDKLDTWRRTSDAVKMKPGIAADAAMEFAPAPAAPMAAHMGTGGNLAAGSEIGAQVLFTFPERFSLASGKTMMLPFVDRKFMMEKVSLYQPEQQPDHPFLSVGVKNDGDSSLPPGILTIYRQDATGGGVDYVGDSQLAFFPKGEKRFISYALDSKTKIDRDVKNTRSMGRVTSSGGVVKVSLLYINETVYRIKAPENEPRRIIIEHPRMAGYKLITSGKNDIETTKSHYRIPVDVPAGKTITYTVRLEKTGWDVVRVDSMSSENILAFIAANDGIDENMRAVFEDIAEIRREMESIEYRIEQFGLRRQIIYQDQERLRKNIGALAGSSDLKTRYLEQLNAQEDELAAIEENLRKFKSERDEKRKELQDRISAL